MSNKNFFFLAVGIWILVVAGADAEVLDLQPVKTDGIQYISGGVGLDERVQMEEMAKGYNVKAVFATASGSYVADVEVRITDAKGGKVLDATSRGPWFYVNLPAGRYTIEAVYKGKSKRQIITAGPGAKSVIFEWKT